MKELLDEIKKLEKSSIKIFKIYNLGDLKMYFRIDIDYNQSQQICYLN
jgi:hypothetical protein